jgi:hypothetical protein
MTHATGMQQIKKIHIKYLGWNIRKKVGILERKQQLKYASLKET